MMIQAILSNPSHPEYGVATIPFPIPHDQYAHCMELLEALEIGDAVKADCKVTKIDSFYTVLKRAEMLTVNVEELNYLAKRLDSFDTGEAAQFQAMAHTSKSAMTPSFNGRTAVMDSVVRPSISLAFLPMAKTSLEFASTATTDGSRSTMPSPRT